KELVVEVNEALTDGLDLDEAHGLPLARFAEEVLASPQDDWEHHQPQLVDEVVLDQRAPELIAGWDDDFSVEFVLQLRDLRHRMAPKDRRVVPVGLLEGGGHDVLGHGVQPVGHFAAAELPPLPEELVAPSTQQPCLSAQCLVERDLGPLCEILAPELAEPAAELEALRTVRVLDHSVKRDVLRAAHDDRSHCSFSFVGVVCYRYAGAATSGSWASDDRPVRASVGVRTGLELRHDAGER